MFHSILKSMYIGVFLFWFFISHKPGPVEHTWTRLKIIQSDSFHIWIKLFSRTKNPLTILSVRDNYSTLIYLYLYWSYSIGGSHSMIRFGVAKTRLRAVSTVQKLCVHISIEKCGGKKWLNHGAASKSMLRTWFARLAYGFLII